MCPKQKGRGKKRTNSKKESFKITAFQGKKSLKSQIKFIKRLDMALKVMKASCDYYESVQ